MAQASKEMLSAIFEQYYRQGQDFERRNAPKQAAKMYRSAAETMLEITRQSSPDIQPKQLRTVDGLIELAKSLESGEAIKKESSGASVSNGITKKSNGEEKEKKEKSEYDIWEVEEDPGLSFDDVAGLSEVKQLVTDRIIKPMKNPGLYEQMGLKAGTGVMMFGLPGTGKTTIAKAIAHETGAAFFAVDSANIFNKFVGDSEKMVKSLFEAARQYKSAVLFFDDFENIGKERDSASGGGGDVNSRIITQLLVEMQGFNTKGDTTFLYLAATNVPWIIDGALTRPGRFAQHVYIPLPDLETRKYLLKLQFKPRSDMPSMVEEGLNLDYYADRLQGRNGADIVEFADTAKYQAIKRAEEQGMSYATICTQDLEYAAQKTRTSVKPDDVYRMREYLKKINYTPFPKEM